jgi:hypothetical protein
MTPPLLGRAILRLCLPASERESIPGDLEEEFALRGRGARKWYLRQAVLSAAPALAMRWRRGEMQELLALLIAIFVMPVVLMLAGGRFVLSHVPLKADALPALFYIPAGLGLTAVCLLGGWLLQMRLGGKR